VCAEKSARAQVRLYDRLFSAEHPGGESDDFLADLNPHSCEIVRDARVEPALAQSAPGDRFQFERVGYFCVDPSSSPGAPVFNRTIGLRDSWAAKQGKP
jgi:glutaminyl-tRNA synthetase